MSYQACPVELQNEVFIGQPGVGGLSTSVPRYLIHSLNMLYNGVITRQDTFYLSYTRFSILPKADRRAHSDLPESGLTLTGSWTTLPCHHSRR